MDRVQGSFERQMRDALAHFYDFSYLQRHPLAAMLLPPEAALAPAHGQELRRVLLDAIDALNPGSSVPRRAPERRAYAILFGLYVEGRSQSEVASALGISTRQLRRDRAAAFRDLAEVLRARQAIPAANAGPQPLHTESQRLACGRQPIDLGELLQGLLSLLAGMARERGVEILSQVPPDLPTPRANRTLVRQILISLASQALASLALSRLTFAADRVEGAAAVRLRLEYRTPEARSEAGQLASSTPHLQSAAVLAATLGGSLQQALWGDRGEVFQLLLPLVGEAVVLVVDDNLELFALFERYVTGEPYRLMHASSADQALALARSLQPQVITVDLMMPGRDGWELLQALHADQGTARIPVIVCSVLEETELAASLGAHSYLKKPVGQADLLRALREAKGPA